MLEFLKQEKSISVSAFASRMNVSEVTIRKDLSFLESQNLLYRAYGCAILINPTINDRHINEKESLNAAQKERIAEMAASLIEPNDTIIIASGTTVSYLARRIIPRKHLTVITASTPVAEILSKHNDIDVILLGGMLRHSSLSVVGHYAEAMMRDFSASKLFIGADGIDKDFGVSTTNMAEAALNVQMMRSASKTVLLCNSSKFGLRGLSRICGAKDIDLVITDTGADSQYVDNLIGLGLNVSLA